MPGFRSGSTSNMAPGCDVNRSLPASAHSECDYRFRDGRSHSTADQGAKPSNHRHPGMDCRMKTAGSGSDNSKTDLPCHTTAARESLTSRGFLGTSGSPCYRHCTRRLNDASGIDVTTPLKTPNGGHNDLDDRNDTASWGERLMIRTNIMILIDRRRLNPQWLRLRPLNRNFIHCIDRSQSKMNDRGMLGLERIASRYHICQ